MVNRSKQLGTSWETALTGYFRDAYWPNAERRAQSGALDKGDHINLPCATEAKNCKTISLATFMDQAVQEAKNADLPFGVAIIKRRRKPVRNAYVVMELNDFTEVLRGWELWHTR